MSLLLSRSTRRYGLAIGSAISIWLGGCLADAAMWTPGSWAQSANSAGGGALSIVADRQSANSETGVIVAEGNVTIRYPAQQVVARSQKATYYTQERRIVLEGNVDVTQNQNHLQAQTVTYRIGDRTIEALPVEGRQVESVYVLPSETQAGETAEKAETSEPL